MTQLAMPGLLPQLPTAAERDRLLASAAAQAAAVASGAPSVAQQAHAALAQLSVALRDAQRAGLAVAPMTVLPLPALAAGIDVLARQERVRLDRIEFPELAGQPRVAYPGGDYRP